MTTPSKEVKKVKQFEHYPSAECIAAWRKEHPEYTLILPNGKEVKNANKE